MGVATAKVIRAAQKDDIATVMREIRGKVPLHDLTDVTLRILKTLEPMKMAKAEKKK